jgi:hypothetical protein
MAPESALPVVASVTRPFTFLSAKLAKAFCANNKINEAKTKRKNTWLNKN